jgi:hypothetical protein
VNKIAILVLMLTAQAYAKPYIVHSSAGSFVCDDETNECTKVNILSEPSIKALPQTTSAPTLTAEIRWWKGKPEPSYVPTAIGWVSTAVLHVAAGFCLYLQTVTRDNYPTYAAAAFMIAKVSSLFSTIILHKNWNENHYNWEIANLL